MAKNLISTAYFLDKTIRLLTYTIDIGDLHDDYIIEVKNGKDWVYKHSFNSISNNHAYTSCKEYINQLQSEME